MTRILYVAYPLLQVSEESAGGAEQVLWTLEREMSRRGLLTTVAASAGSRASGEQFATGDSCTLPDDYERRRVEHEDRVVELVRRRDFEGETFDLVHDMSGSFWRRAAEIEAPVLATLHLPRSFYPAGSFLKVAENVRFNCVSELQARSFADLEGMIGVAPNGIALDGFDIGDGEWQRGAEDRQKLLWLGRICEEKAPHLALEIAECAEFKITIAGQIYPFSYHQQYFDREVAPQLRTPGAEFVIAPKAEMKRQLLRSAKALLITSLAEEASSLVAMEAAAAGTPVVAFRRGALPEVVREGVTGFLVDDVDQAVAALQRVTSIRSEDCVRHAQKTFSSRAMAERYGWLYQELIRGKSDRSAA